MLNQLRADYYKLFHSKLCWVAGSFFAVFLVLFVIMAMKSIPFPFGGEMGQKGGIPLIDGFVGFKYRNPDKPLFWELAYSSTVFTGFLWIILMALSVQFISKEYQTGTIKLAVSYGVNIYRVFISKWIVVISYSGVLFYVYNLATFTAISLLKHRAPSIGDLVSLIELVSLYFLILIVFTLICFALYIATKNSVAVLSIIPAFMFLVIVFAASYGNNRPLIVDCYLSINPMYYLDMASRFWADSAVTSNILMFAAAGIPILLVSSFLILKRQEIK